MCVKIAFSVTGQSMPNTLRKYVNWNDSLGLQS